MIIGKDYLLRESRLSTFILLSCSDLLLFYLRMLVIIIDVTKLQTGLTNDCICVHVEKSRASRTVIGYDG